MNKTKIKQHGVVSSSVLILMILSGCIGQGSEAEPAQLETPGTANAIYVSGDYAYIADGNQGLFIADISTPMSPTIAGSYPISGFTSGVFINGNYAYLAATGLEIRDISNPLTPTLVAQYPSDSNPKDIFIDNNRAYLVGSLRLEILDISVPTNPTLLGASDNPGIYGGENVFVSGDYAYVTYGKTGFQILDISDPADINQEFFYDPSEGSTGRANGIYVSDNIAYLGYNNDLTLFDVSDPTATQYIAEMSVGNYIFLQSRDILSVSVSGIYAFLGTVDSVEVVKIDDPSDIDRRGQYQYKVETPITTTSGTTTRTTVRSDVKGSFEDVFSSDAEYLYTVNTVAGLLVFKQNDLIGSGINGTPASFESMLLGILLISIIRLKKKRCR